MILPPAHPLLTVLAAHSLPPYKINEKQNVSESELHKGTVGGVRMEEGKKNAGIQLALVSLGLKGTY